METPTSNALSLEMQREKEQLLWEELRGLRDIALKMLQWGVTALASLQIALFSLRKDLAERLLAAKQIQPGQWLPLGLYFRGTGFLLMVALIFSFLLLLTGNRYRKMRAQLVALNVYQIEFGSTSKSARWVVLFVFVSFPVLDAVIRLSLE